MQATVTLPADRRAPRRARAWVDDVAAGLDRTVLDDLRLVITEIVTNAVKYGPGEPIHVCLHVRAPSQVRGIVIDHGDHAHQIRLRSPDVLTTGGRGLRIVHELAERWGVEEGSTHVWFHLGDRPRQGPRPRHATGDGRTEDRAVRSRTTGARGVRPPPGPGT